MAVEAMMRPTWKEIVAVVAIVLFLGLMEGAFG